ncbi:unnamed protein product [Boreogadus saida]
METLGSMTMTAKLRGLAASVRCSVCLQLTFQSRRFSSAEPSLAPSSASWLLKGQLGHGDSRTRVSRPCFLGSPHLEGGVGRVGAGDSYSSAVTGRITSPHRVVAVVHYSVYQGLR